MIEFPDSNNLTGYVDWWDERLLHFHVVDLTIQIPTVDLWPWRQALAWPVVTDLDYQMEIAFSVVGLVPPGAPEIQGGRERRIDTLTIAVKTTLTWLVETREGKMATFGVTDFPLALPMDAVRAWLGLEESDPLTFGAHAFISLMVDDLVIKSAESWIPWKQ